MRRGLVATGLGLLVLCGTAWGYETYDEAYTAAATAFNSGLWDATITAATEAQALAVTPHQRDMAHLLIAWSHGEKGDTATAKTEYEAIVASGDRFHPVAGQVLAALINIETVAGKTQAALNHIVDVLGSTEMANHVREEAWLMLATRAPDWADVLTAFDTKFPSLPNTGEAWAPHYYRAKILDKGGLRLQVVQECTRAYGLTPVLAFDATDADRKWLKCIEENILRLSARQRWGKWSEEQESKVLP